MGTNEYFVQTLSVYFFLHRGSIELRSKLNFFIYFFDAAALAAFTCLFLNVFLPVTLNLTSLECEISQWSRGDERLSAPIHRITPRAATGGAQEVGLLCPWARRFTSPVTCGSVDWQLCSGAAPV